MRRFMRAISILALGLIPAACGSSSGSHSSSVASPSSASASASATTAASPTTHGSGCAALVADQTPRGSGSGPSLASLIAPTGNHAVRSMSLVQTTCVSTAASITRSEISSLVEIRPKLEAEFSETGAGKSLQGRIVGGNEFLDVPGLSVQDGGRPWLKVSLARAGAQVGINLSELFSEVANLDPSRNLKLLAAASDFESLGAATIDGHRTFEYHGVFDIRHLPSAGLSADLMAQLAAKIRSVGATEEIVTSYVTPAGHAVRLVTALPNTARGSIYTIEDIRAINPVVSVPAPPAPQTIGYQQALKLSSN
jgi:hypothetical protein